MRNVIKLKKYYLEFRVTIKLIAFFSRTINQLLCYSGFIVQELTVLIQHFYIFHIVYFIFSIAYAIRLYDIQ